MKKSSFTDEQIAFVLKQAETGGSMLSWCCTVSGIESPANTLKSIELLESNKNNLIPQFVSSERLLSLSLEVRYSIA